MEDFEQNQEQEEVIDPKRLVKTVRKKRQIRRVRKTQGVFRNFFRDSSFASWFCLYFKNASVVS